MSFLIEDELIKVEGNDYIIDDEEGVMNTEGDNMGEKITKTIKHVEVLAAINLIRNYLSQNEFPHEVVMDLQRSQQSIQVH